MKKQLWIPRPNELVRWNGKFCIIIYVDLDGKCRIKDYTTTHWLTKRFTVDVSELERISK